MWAPGKPGVPEFAPLTMLGEPPARRAWSDPPSPSSSTGAVGLVPLVRVATSVASSPLLSPSPPTPKTACYLKPRA